jgi:NAD(P)-dependent dehydrogenase (short-subunit alcohol dehydrogenase family)
MDVKDLKDRVAVVTGAASGIGFALAECFASEGMKLVLADVEEEALARSERSLRSSGAEVVSVPTDVSDPDQVEHLAIAALSAFGAVHVVCNNAGVSVGSRAPLWEASRADWEWVVGVNMWGVINGVRTFVPILLEQDRGHVVNTASIAGLIPATLGIYSVTKHAVVAVSEALQLQLAARGAAVGVSVLCPGWVHTRIADAERNRPERYQQQTPAEVDAAQAAARQALIAGGAPPSTVAASVLDAIRQERFYVLPHPEWLPLVRQRAEDIEHGRPPTVPDLAAVQTPAVAR